MRDDKIKQVEEWAEERGLLIEAGEGYRGYAYKYHDIQAQTMKLHKELWMV